MEFYEKKVLVLKKLKEALLEACLFSMTLDGIEEREGDSTHKTYQLWNDEIDDLLTQVSGELDAVQVMVDMKKGK